MNLLDLCLILALKLITSVIGGSGMVGIKMEWGVSLKRLENQWYDQCILWYEYDMNIAISSN